MRAGIVLGFLVIVMAAPCHALCSITTLPGNLAFGPIDPAGAVPVTASTTMRIACAPGNTVVVTDNGGLHNSGTSKRMVNTGVGTQFLPYTVTYAPNNVKFNTVPGGIITISGSIAVLDFSNAYVGSYTDDFIITVSP